MLWRCSMINKLLFATVLSFASMGLAYAQDSVCEKGHVFLDFEGGHGFCMPTVCPAHPPRSEI